MSKNFLPAPSVPKVSSFEVQVWNGLAPLFQLFSQSYARGPVGQAKSQIQSLLGIQLPSAGSSRAPYTGDPLIDMVDSMLYNNGQPLAAGSAPLYGTYWDGMGHSAGEALSMQPGRHAPRPAAPAASTCRSRARANTDLFGMVGCGADRTKPRR